MTTEVIHAAAQARAFGMAARKDRPQERRCMRAALDGGRWTPGIRSAVVIRESTDPAGDLSFTGQASAYEQPYTMYDFFGEYTEVVTAGAGEDSLNRADLQVPLVIQHDQSKRIAATWVTDGPGQLTLTESDSGLDVSAPNLDPTDADVRAIVPKLKSGLVREMSFAFRIDQGVWSPDYSEFRINKFDIHRGDVAIVGFGANPNTTADLRSDPRPDTRAAQRLRLMLELELNR